MDLTFRELQIHFSIKSRFAVSKPQIYQVECDVRKENQKINNTKRQ